MKWKTFQQQIAVLRERQCATRLVIKLFEHAADQSEIDEITGWFNLTHQAASLTEVKQAIQALQALAAFKHLVVDP